MWLGGKESQVFVAFHSCLRHLEDSYLLGLGRRRGTGFPGPLLVLGGRRESRHREEKQERRGEVAIEDSTTNDIQGGVGLA